MIYKFLIILLFLIVINATDIREYKIKNKIVLPAICVGLIFNLIIGNITDSLFGMLIPLVLFPLFALKMLGAGDIKALCAIGAVVGFEMCLKVMALTFISGGVIALVFMIFGKSMIKRFKYLFSYLKTCFIMRKIEKYNFGGSNDSYFRFSYAITSGTLLAFINYYLHIF